MDFPEIFLETNQSSQQPQVSYIIFIKLHCSDLESLFVISQRGMHLTASKAQHIFYFWWPESHWVVFHCVLLKGARHSFSILEQLIALVRPLHQKTHKSDSTSNVVCFRRDKQFTGDGERCFLGQFQFLMWLWRKAISGRAGWMKSRVLGPGLNLPCHIQRRATNNQGNESSFPPEDGRVCLWIPLCAN